MAYTIPNALQWPPELLLRERGLKWAPDFQNAASPPALDGTRQIRSLTGGGLWRMAMTSIQLRRLEQVAEWLAFEIQMHGGLVPVDVPLFLTGYQPNPLTSSPAAIAASAGGWPARAVSGRVVLSNAQDLRPGQHFSTYDASIYGWRLYRIEAVEDVAASLASGASDYRDITFWPPARVAVADDAELEIDRPRCVMRLASSSSADLDLEYRKRGDPGLEFVEAA